MRLFLALEVPDDLRQRLVARAREAGDGLPAPRWVRPETLHLTLAFLGDTDPTEVERVDGLLKPICARHRPMTLRMTSAGAFPPRRPARVAWMGVEAAGDELLPLQREAAEALRRQGFPIEKRRFHPHLTVGRCRQPWHQREVEAWVARLDGTGPGGDGLDGVDELRRPFRVAEVVLFESELRPDGARHSAVSRYPLGGEEGAA